MKKLNNTEAGLKKSVAYEKKRVICRHLRYIIRRFLPGNFENSQIDDFFESFSVASAAVYIMWIQLESSITSQKYFVVKYLIPQKHNISSQRHDFYLFLRIIKIRNAILCVQIITFYLLVSMFGRTCKLLDKYPVNTY